MKTVSLGKLKMPSLPSPPPDCIPCIEPTEQPAPLNSKAQWTALNPNKISSSFLSREKSSQAKAKRQTASTGKIYPSIRRIIIMLYSI